MIYSGLTSSEKMEFFNAVQRLQKIESDLKTVISIYDITSKTTDEYDRPETPHDKPDTAHLSQISSPKQLENAAPSDKCQESSTETNSSFLYSWKKTSSFGTQGLHSGESGVGRQWKFRKPGSAPTSSSTLSTICESDYNGQPISESTNKVLEKSILSKAKTFDDLKSQNESDSNSDSVHELLMTSSKTLQTAYEILAKNNYKKNDVLDEISETPSCTSVTCKIEDTEDCKLIFENHEVDHTFKVKTIQPLKRNSSFNFEKLKEQLEKENAVVERSRSVSPRKYSSKTSKPLVVAKFSNESKKNKSSLEISPKYNTVPRKIPKLESSISESSEEKRNTKVRCEIRSTQEKNIKQSKIEKDDRSTKRNSVDGSTNSVHSKELNSRSPLRIHLKVREEKFDANCHEEKKIQNMSEKDKKVKFFEAISGSNNQKVTRNSDQASQEFWMNKFSKITEINNEKMEKIKVSKELALDIAKHLKVKYDEIQQTKDELMEKMQEVERDNERLKNEIKDVNESKVKLQLKIEGLKEDSTTKLTEQDTKTKDIIAENGSLKAKICEIQKQCNEELLKKQKEIDQIQKERLAEMRNDIKSRENRENDLQRLKSEKSVLQSQLNDRNCKIEILEQKIRHLQEEVQKQKQQLKKKTERLEETNKELESIHQNSRDLEEQVKTLRKNIENFDEIQQTLLKQTVAYDQQIKANQEEITKLKEENSKLKIELENEKDGLLIKTKIIEDQQETIKQLRDKSDETKTLLKRNQSLERILNIEREEKLELQDAVERLKWRKDELKKKVKALENDLLLAPQEVVRDLQKTQLVLHELENQVQTKQREWELQFQTLLKEKAQACSVAEFATRKLMQTTSEFQKQAQAHKKLHRILAENLAEKEKCLREVNEKKNCTQSKQSVSNVHPDLKVNWLRDRHSSTIDDDDAILDWYFRNLSCCEDIKTKSSLHFS